jgi:pyruvate-ferredoxin/flavodoxin oxidoreductase
LPAEVQQQLIEKRLRFFVVDGYKVAAEAGLGQRINTVLQTCFFALANVLPREQALEAIKSAVRSTFAKRGETVLRRNFAAIDAALHELHEVDVPGVVTSSQHRRSAVPPGATDFVKRVTSIIMAGNGDLLPVSAFPPDGTFPTGTARFEKRSIATEIPIWDPDICIECGLCALVCPHAAIRMKVFETTALSAAPAEFRSIPWSGKDFAGHQMAIQVAPDDCTGCGVCVDVCPARSKEIARHKAIDMMPIADHLNRERAGFDFFLSIPEIDRSKPAVDTVKGCQLLQPLFEFSGACAGCGETPYLKLLTQLFGDRIVIANATGCSSIYGGNLPATPWSQNCDGRGPAWSNSLFEDNAEFGLGMRLAIDQQVDYARRLLKDLSGELGDNLVRAILEASQTNEAEISAQRSRVSALKESLARINKSRARDLLTIADVLVQKSVWIIGGDGWAYDIGFGGLDHVLASGQNVNILVLDTEVYSNTGGQASKSTPRGAVAKFAANGRPTRKKDLGMLAVDYGNVYVAQIAVGAQPLQTIRAFHEAQSYNGTSLILAYSHCIAHGIDMSTSMTHQKDAVNSAYWPLFRYDPRAAVEGGHPFHLDSRKPTVPLQKFAGTEARYAMLARSNPERAKQLMGMAQNDIDERWQFYEQMAGIERVVTD